MVDTNSRVASNRRPQIWGFPKIRGTLLGVPITRIIVFRGLYWGSLILGNYHLNAIIFVQKAGPWNCCALLTQVGAKILYPASGNQSGASARVKGPGHGVYNGDSCF